MASQQAQSQQDIPKILIQELRDQRQEYQVFQHALMNNMMAVF